MRTTWRKATRQTLNRAHDTAVNGKAKTARMRISKPSLESDMLLSLAGSKGQSSNSLNVVSIAGGGSILSLVVHLDSLVHVSSLADNGDLECSNRLHDSVVRGIKEDTANSIISLDWFSSSSGSSLLGSLLSLGLGSELLGEGLLGIFLTSHLAGGLGTVVGTGLGSLGHYFFSSLGLQLNEGDGGVLQTNPLHGLDVSTSVALKLSQGRVHVIKILIV